MKNFMNNRSNKQEVTLMKVYEEPTLEIVMLDDVNIVVMSTDPYGDDWFND